jgi:hypothetical protein
MIYGLTLREKLNPFCIILCYTYQHGWLKLTINLYNRWIGSRNSPWWWANGAHAFGLYVATDWEVCAECFQPIAPGHPHFLCEDERDELEQQMRDDEAADSDYRFWHLEQQLAYDLEELDRPILEQIEYLLARDEDDRYFATLCKTCFIEHNGSGFCNYHDPSWVERLNGYYTPLNENRHT